MIKKSMLFKIISLLLLGAVLVAIYFSFSTIVTPDGIAYYNYLKILKGELPLSSWDPVRGPSMPLIILGIVTLFGDTSLGFLIGTFLFFLATICIAYLIIKEILKIQNNNIIRIIIGVLFVGFFIFNPLIIGYYHVMLTEFVGATVAVLCCFLSIKWINIEINTSALKVVFYSFAFIFLSVFMWFVKQPYVITVLIPLILGTFISIYKIRNLKNILLKLFVLFACFASVLIAISYWDTILVSNAALSPTNWSSNSLSGQLIKGATNFREIEVENFSEKNISEWPSHLNSQEIELIEKIEKDKTVYSGYDLYEVLSIRESIVIDIVVVPTVTYEAKSFKDIMLFFNVAMKEYPQHLLASYFSNYLAIINLTHLDHTNYVPIKKLLKFNEFHGENELIGLAIYYSYSSVLGNLPVVLPCALETFPQYVKEVNPYDLLSTPVFMFLIRFSLLLLTVSLFLAPVLFAVFSFLYLLEGENRSRPRDILYESMIVLFGYSFFHVLFHAFLGAVVDRYSFPAYPTSILGLLFLLGLITKRIDKSSS